jgi:phosphohistidine swiveling domain-containing protein
VQSDLTKFYEKQISLTEWFEALGHPDAAKLRVEDSGKHKRLDVLNRLIGLPFAKPTRFPATEVAARSTAFKKFLKAQGDMPCAIRLIPKNPDVPKLRMRGHTVAEATKWFDEQKIDPKDYDADFIPHDNTRWATIFIVTDAGVFGEVKRGPHNQLTQGLYEDNAPNAFKFNFKEWQFSDLNPEAEAHVKELVTKIHTADNQLRRQIASELDAGFAKNYLKGYFETSTSDEFGIWFIDYNRLLGDFEPTPAKTTPTKDALVTGRTGSPGKATGTVRIVEPDALGSTKLKKTDVLVCKMTTPDYLPLMKQAAAIVTDLGGILSHAAIIARELKKPCLTGTQTATTVLKEGQKVQVDASSGAVFAL